VADKRTTWALHAAKLALHAAKLARSGAHIACCTLSAVRTTPNFVLSHTHTEPWLIISTLKLGGITFFC
jgi:hypothetical protein